LPASTIDKIKSSGSSFRAATSFHFFGVPGIKTSLEPFFLFWPPWYGSAIKTPQIAF